jgi:hypothetical protein
MDRTAACAVNRLVCEDCATVYYSAAAKTLVEDGERCANCGGRLTILDEAGKVVANGAPPVADDAGDDPTE